MSEKKLKDEELGKVAGGDNGDYKKEWSSYPGGVNYLYEIGEEIEVYNTGFHVGTTRYTITDRRPFAYRGGWVGEYQYFKCNDIWGNPLYEWVLADDIESK